MSFTHNPKKRKRKKVHGFRSRRKNSKVLNRRRSKKRQRLTV